MVGQALPAGLYSGRKTEVTCFRHLDGKEGETWFWPSRQTMSLQSFYCIFPCESQGECVFGKPLGEVNNYYLYNAFLYGAVF